MTRFKQGPANDAVLSLKCSPLLLRVVERGGKFDALDQPEDTPAKDEKIYAYERIELLGSAHVNMGRGRGGFYPIATYQFIEAQPDDATMRHVNLWAEWCRAREKK